jgi:pyridoxine kinase
VGILSIQSQVVAGHVGNSAAGFALQCVGRDVWQIPTILLSHHPGHGGAQGGPMPAALLTSLLDGMASRGRFAQCEAVISGYLGSAETEAVVIDAVRRAKAANPDSVYHCDPVMGDDGRTYVGHDIVTAMHNLAAIADILTPNAYELSLLTGITPQTRAEALQVLRAAQALGPGIVVLTGFTGADTPPGAIDVLAADGPRAWRVTQPRLAQKFSGAGDLFSALFLNFWLEKRETDTALARACAATLEVLSRTAETGADELALIASQTQMLSPRHNLTPEPMA